MQEYYFVYILQCSDQSYFVGQTGNDVLTAYTQHLEGIPGSFTYLRRPVKLLYYETIPGSEDAAKREKQIQGWSRAKKKALIDQNFHKLQLLSVCQNMTHHKYYNPDQSPSSFDFAQDEVLPSHSPASSTAAVSSPAQSPSTTLRAGILGGGQLGRMLLQEAANYPVQTYVLENDPHCPSAHLCHHFVQGNIQDFDAVYNFGKELDVITIEIESVNVEALEKLQSEGVKVFPNPAAIKIIKNKILQKEFYLDHLIQSPEFKITDNLAHLQQHHSFLPAVHKLAMGGYDGKGVQVLQTANHLHKGFNEPSVLEKMVDIKKEIAIMVAMNAKGETAIYPAAEMVFDQQLNLLDYQLSPAELEPGILSECESTALKVVKALQSPGIFAIELFIDVDNKVWVNETAPRVHNSGHHTIEANYSSQFDMLWRVMLGYPLGNTKPLISSAIVNIVGAPGYSGQAIYKGLEEVLKMENVFVHLYGKLQTKPGRKMGHVTILSNNKKELTDQAHAIKNTLQVVSK